IRNWALTNVTITATDFVADMPNIPGNPHFTGKVIDAGKKISGDFEQGGAKLAFSVEQKAAKNPADTLSGFDDFANGALKSWNVPGAAMAIVANGKVVSAKGFGLRDVKNNLPVTPDTLFPIGSCTKAFTTFVLGQLVDEGKLEWHKPVGRYVPGFRMFDDVTSRELTPRDLVPHREALPRHDHDKLIEIPFREVGNMGPAGSIDSSVNEMAQWVLLHLGDSDKKLISPTTLRELHTPQFAISQLPLEPEFGPQSYAMGWFVDTYRGHLRTQHGGNIDGFSALVTLFPNDHIGFVVLTNGNGTPLPNILTLHAADRLLKLDPKDWNADRLAKRAQNKTADKEAESKKNVTRKTG